MKQNKSSVLQIISHKLHNSSRCLFCSDLYAHKLNEPEKNVTKSFQPFQQRLKSYSSQSLSALKLDKRNLSYGLAIIWCGVSILLESLSDEAPSDAWNQKEAHDTLESQVPTNWRRGRNTAGQNFELSALETQIWKTRSHKGIQKDNFSQKQQTRKWALEREIQTKNILLIIVLVKQ